MQVSLIPNEHVDSIWPLIGRYMDMAAEYTFGRYTAEDIKDSILNYDHHLWIAFDEGSNNDIKGVVVTNFVQYPRMRCLAMQFTAGEDLKDWKAPMLELLQKWAFDNGCDKIESSGRPGWPRVLRDDGANVLWHTYELPVADSGFGGY